eukprot:TRINITY_DN5082_c0_g1_i1.p1 TRINITY_DN5082_c0_g1~~TRINITY_DN5082_c0_g1_i1.p1  ORF type:complete len:476 (-),score=47.53 TRINITY_DN5082_c0_g1_i1:45-1472(-)
MRRSARIVSRNLFCNQTRVSLGRVRRGQAVRKCAFSKLVHSRNQRSVNQQVIFGRYRQLTKHNSIQKIRTRRDYCIVTDSPPDSKASSPPQERAPNDAAKVIFDDAWEKITKKFNETIFPKELTFLMGAPGSGKGTNTPFILERQGIAAPPIIVSSLLDESPELRALKDRGEMISDSVVVAALLEKLLEPIFADGCLIDGFPRTTLQVEIVRLLFNKMNDLKKLQPKLYPRPRFRMVVLWVDQQTSIQRQMDRAKQAQVINKEVEEIGIGEQVLIRSTDISEKAVYARYATFKAHFGTLISLREIFPFHLINASGSIEDVQKQIEDQIIYQSAMELDDATYAQISRVPLAEQIAVNSKQSLVKRLDDYQSFYPSLFNEVLGVIENDFIPEIQRQPMAGKVLIRRHNPLFVNKQAVAMVLDIMSERGFKIVYDTTVDRVPDRVSKAGQIICTYAQRHYFSVSFPVHDLRGQTSNIT